MLRFLLIRLSVLLPGLLLLSMLVFGLSRWVNDDPVLKFLPADDIRGASANPRAYDRAYRAGAVSLDRHLPVFYFNFTTAAHPDTLHRILRRDQRAVQLELLRQSGNWPAVQSWYRGLQQLAYDGEATTATLARDLLTTADHARIERKLAAADTLPRQLRYNWDVLQSAISKGRLLLPALRWHGSDNQFHRWLGRIVSGDFGLSTLDRRPVWEKLRPAIGWTVLFNGIAIFLAYLISVPLGLYTAWWAGGRLDRWANTLLLMLFSLPAFWVASMLSSFLTTPAFGFDLFPTLGVGNPDPDGGWWHYLSVRAYHFFLPVFCLTYPSLAYLTRQTRSAAKAEMAKAYVKTARLKGLGRHRIIWGHIFRNASFPLITLLASLLPALLAGSVLIEIIFNLPGMGRLLVEAALASDWPVVIGITLLNGLLTIVGILLADLGYALADPRVRLGQPTNPATS